MMAGLGCQRAGLSIVAFALMLAAVAAKADAPGGIDSGDAGTVTPAGRPGPSSAPPAAEPAPPKNLEAFAAGETLGLLGKKVRDAAGEDMGMMIDVLVDREGRPRAAVIDFGGFLGVGSRKIAIDWRLLQFNLADPNATVLLGLSRAEVQAAPEYKPATGQPIMIVGPPPPSTDAPASSDAAK